MKRAELHDPLCPARRSLKTTRGRLRDNGRRARLHLLSVQTLFSERLKGDFPPGPAPAFHHHRLAVPRGIRRTRPFQRLCSKMRLYYSVKSLECQGGGRKSLGKPVAPMTAGKKATRGTDFVVADGDFQSAHTPLFWDCASSSHRRRWADRLPAPLLRAQPSRISLALRKALFSKKT